MAPPAPKQPVPHCRFPAQIAIEAVLFTVAAFVPFQAALVLVLIAVAIPIYCFAKAEPPEETGQA